MAEERLAEAAERLGRGRFRFLDFGPKAVRSALARFDYVGRGDPPIEILEQVLFHPGMRCLYDAAGRRIEISKPTYVEEGAPRWPNRELKTLKVEARVMPDQIDPSAGMAVVTEPVLFLGHLNQHFGHFLTDTMARMWPLEAEGRGLKVLFAPRPETELDLPFVRFVLRTLGLEDSRILRPEAPTLFRQVICPAPSLQLSRIYRMFDRPHRRVSDEVLGPLGPLDRRPVYLSRGGLGEGHRDLPGEEALEARLTREGYRIVRPETLGMAQQIALFNGLGPVVGAFGSALHTLAFRDRLFGQKLAILFPDKIVERFLMVDMVKGSRAAYLNCMSEVDPVEDRLLSLNQRAWAVDANAAMDLLDQAGFLGRRARAA